MNETRALTTEEEMRQLETEIPLLQNQLDAKRQRYTYLTKLQAGLVLSAEETRRIQREFDESRRRKEEAQLALEEAARQEATEARAAEKEKARLNNERIQRQAEERENYIRSMSPPR